MNKRNERKSTSTCSPKLWTANAKDHHAFPATTIAQKRKVNAMDTAMCQKETA
jgi:hypothetical protein